MHVQRWAHTLNDRDGGHCYCYTNSCPLGNEQTPLKVTENRSSAAAMSLVPLSPIRCSFPVFFIQPPSYLPEAQVLPDVSPADSRSQSKYLCNQSSLCPCPTFLHCCTTSQEQCSKEKKRNQTTDLQKSTAKSRPGPQCHREKACKCPLFLLGHIREGEPNSKHRRDENTHS